MQRTLLYLVFMSSFFSIAANSQALTPEITSWVLNTSGTTGYGGITANVQQVSYTNTDVYVTCTCIPGYDIGPWAGNPNTPANQNFCFKITRNPVEKTGTKTNTGLGHIGVWSNGVSIFNAKDAFSYNNQGVWNQDALPNEGSSFDDCLGHPAPNGEYHHHVNPTCLYDDQNTQVHSPILGYAFDGFPIYGAYAYANTDGTGPITRMRTGYRLRNITTRTTLPDGSTASSAGPIVSTQYPLGKYLEDYEYVASIGDLDEYNGRVCVTPEYPSGTYAYFVTIDVNGNPVYPYTVGPKYYGVVQQGNTGPQSGHNTIPTGATPYSVPTGIEEAAQQQIFTAYPNPFTEKLAVQTAVANRTLVVAIYDVTGKQMFKQSITDGGNLNTTSLPLGVYSLRVTDAEGSTVYTQRIIKQ